MSIFNQKLFLPTNSICPIHHYYAIPISYRASQASIGRNIMQRSFIRKCLWLVSTSMIVCFFTFNTDSNISSEPIKLSEELILNKVMKNVYLVTHSFPWPANSLIVRYPNQAIVWIDTPYTNEATQTAWQWITSTFNESRIMEINTGFHNDNLGGNGFLSQEGIEIYGATLTVHLLTERAESTRQELLEWLKKPHFKKYHDVHAKAVYTPPTHLFPIEKGIKFTFDDETIEVFYPGPSHSDDNLSVYFTKKKLLWGGCMVKSKESKTLGFTKDADLIHWPHALKKLLHRYTKTRIVIPGHGNPGGIDLIKHTLSMF